MSAPSPTGPARASVHASFARHDVTDPEVLLPARPRDPRTSRDKIVESAERMFAQYGYYGSGLRTIATVAGISHPGLLHHFPSKEALLEAVIDGMEARASCFQEATAALEADPSAIGSCILAALDPTCHTTQLLGRLTSESVAADFPARYRLGRLRKVYEHLLETCLRAAADTLPGGPLIAPEPAARALFSMIMGHAVRERTVRRMQSRAPQDDPRADVRALLAGLLHGGGQRTDGPLA